MNKYINKYQLYHYCKINYFALFSGRGIPEEQKLNKRVFHFIFFF